MRVYLIPSHQKKMSQTLTTNQVSSPYAMYKPETKVALLPYEVLRVASQFIYKNDDKQLLQGIHLKVDKNEITIGSTDGHRMFYFQFPINVLGFELKKDITIPGSIFKTQVKNATKVLITDDLITFQDEQIKLSSVPYRELAGTYPNILQLIPEKFTNNFEGKEFSFNCDYVGQFCNQVKKLSSNKSITFNGNTSKTPFIISAKWDIKNPFEDLEGFEAKLNYLIMPIVNLERNKK